MAHAKITCVSGDGRETDVHLSGDLAGFEMREDAIVYARQWAVDWLGERYG